MTPLLTDTITCRQRRLNIDSVSIELTVGLKLYTPLKLPMVLKRRLQCLVTCDLNRKTKQISLEKNLIKPHCMLMKCLFCSDCSIVRFQCFIVVGFQFTVYIDSKKESHSWTLTTLREHGSGMDLGLLMQLHSHYAMLTV